MRHVAPSLSPPIFPSPCVCCAPLLQCPSAKRLEDGWFLIFVLSGAIVAALTSSCRRVIFKYWRQPLKVKEEQASLRRILWRLFPHLPRGLIALERQQHQTLPPKQLDKTAMNGLRLWVGCWWSMACSVSLACFVRQHMNTSCTRLCGVETIFFYNFNWQHCQTTLKLRFFRIICLR